MVCGEFLDKCRCNFRLNSAEIQALTPGRGERRTTPPSAIEQAIELQHNQGYLKFAESARQELAELRRDLEEAESDVQRLHLECAASNSERDSLREMLAVAEEGLEYISMGSGDVAILSRNYLVRIAEMKKRGE